MIISQTLTIVLYNYKVHSYCDLHTIDHPPCIKCPHPPPPPPPPLQCPFPALMTCSPPPCKPYSSPSSPTWALVKSCVQSLICVCFAWLNQTIITTLYMYNAHNDCTVRLGVGLYYMGNIDVHHLLQRASKGHCPWTYNTYVAFTRYVIIQMYLHVELYLYVKLYLHMLC